jgi:FKBP-type peptidyl-prolyl cis-trans isomerase
MIYYTGSGKAAVKGMQASVRFTLRLLNGQQIYSSDSAGLKEITLGYSGVETGLEEGLLHLHQGDRAKFIIPSYLAFGLLGDQHKIPPGATLVYDLELVDLKIPGNGNP